MDNEADEILKLLIEQSEKRWNIRQLALARGINYKSAYLAVQRLSKERVVRLEPLGNTTLCTHTRILTPRVFAAEWARREELKDMNLRIVQKRLEAIHAPLIALLFGSRAKGTATKHSDYDILIISPEHERAASELSLLPLDIHVTGITIPEFISMASRKGFNVVTEAVKKNIILVGIEEYYRLLHETGEDSRGRA